MSTVSKRIADEIVVGNGYYPGDNIRVVKIVQYDNAFGGKGESFGLIYAGQRMDIYNETEWVRNPRTYWQAKEVVPGAQG